MWLEIHPGSILIFATLLDCSSIFFDNFILKSILQGFFQPNKHRYQLRNLNCLSGHIFILSARVCNIAITNVKMQRVKYGVFRWYVSYDSFYKIQNNLVCWPCQGCQRVASLNTFRPFKLSIYAFMGSFETELSARFPIDH